MRPPPTPHDRSLDKREGQLRDPQLAPPTPTGHTAVSYQRPDTRYRSRQQLSAVLNTGDTSNGLKYCSRQNLAGNRCRPTALNTGHVAADRNTANLFTEHQKTQTNNAQSLTSCSRGGESKHPGGDGTAANDGERQPGAAGRANHAQRAATDETEDTPGETGRGGTKRDEAAFTDEPRPPQSRCRRGPRVPDRRSVGSSWHAARRRP